MHWVKIKIQHRFKILNYTVKLVSSRHPCLEEYIVLGWFIKEGRVLKEVLLNEFPVFGKSVVCLEYQNDIPLSTQLGSSTHF